MSPFYWDFLMLEVGNAGDSHRWEPYQCRWRIRDSPDNRYNCWYNTNRAYSRLAAAPTNRPAPPSVTNPAATGRTTASTCSDRVERDLRASQALADKVRRQAEAERRDAERASQPVARCRQSNRPGPGRAASIPLMKLAA